jgi:hypothetical protein
VQEEAAVRGPRIVRAGPATALLDGGFLRRIRVGADEVLRGVYAAVRDQNWGTIEPHYPRYEVEQGDDRFRVSFTAEHRAGEIDFVWEGEIVGEPSGRITFSLDGVCRRAFRKNRLGFCVLHPPELAGRPYVRETPDGPIEERFPERISPSRDVTDMRAIRYAVGPVAVELRFEGDLFDMEDQRNWTDASYKTFCTPLRRPYPVALAAGQRISQSVTLELGLPAGDRAPGPARAAPASRAPGGGAARDAIAEREAAVVVSGQAIGRLPPIGLGAASHGRALEADQVERLRRLGLAHRRVDLPPRRPGWRERLEVAAADAAALGLALEVAVVTGGDGAGLAEVAPALAGLSAPTLRLAPFAEGSWLTTAPLVEAARAGARAAGLSTLIGGGTRADFHQLNSRHAEVPLEALDFAAYAINPQVHAFDDLSVMETLGAQGPTVESARAIVGDRPIVVGPITLRPRFNPVATEPEPPPPPGALPQQADPRQATSFAAAWTVGSLHRLARAGAAALTYFETTGWSGVLAAANQPRHPDFPSAPGGVYPVYELLAALGDFGGAELLDLSVGDPLATEALALRKGRRVLVLVANLTDGAHPIRVVLPAALTAPRVRQGDSERSTDTRASGLMLELNPYAVAQVTASIG